MKYATLLYVEDLASPRCFEDVGQRVLGVPKTRHTRCATSSLRMHVTDFEQRY